MGSERLVFPEEKLDEVIEVIREGIKLAKVSKETKQQLDRWCDKMEGEKHGGD